MCHNSVDFRTLLSESWGNKSYLPTAGSLNVGAGVLFIKDMLVYYQFLFLRSLMLCIICVFEMLSNVKDADENIKKTRRNEIDGINNLTF